MDQKQQQVIFKSEELFMKYGLKSVTMDDIARHLGVSKKTLYQYFDNKKDLIQQIFNCRIDFEKDMMDTIREESADAVEEMLKVARYSIRMLRKVSPAAMYDLKKYYHHIWHSVESLHQQYFFEILRENIERGIKQGVYRPDVNADIISKLYVGKISQVVNDELFPIGEYDRADLFKEFFNYHMHGIASPTGLELLEQHYQTILEES